VPDVDAATNLLWWINWAKIIGAFLVAIGVAAEFLGDWIAKPYEETIEVARKSEIIRLTNDTTRLTTDAELARASIAEANARQKEAELKLAQLEKKVVPRVITEEQAEGIIDKIRPFPDMPFAVEADPAAEYGFVDSLIKVLQRAGWKWQSYSTSLTSLPVGNIGLPNFDSSGVQVRINASRPDFVTPGQTLATALAQVLPPGVGFLPDPPESPFAASPDAIHIEIRRKL
jgi:hypothetical protein